jgi:RimJ/RimL family protein N-acetyltransferase
MSRRDILLKTEHFTVELLSAADLDLAIQLNKTCSEFFLFQNGLPPGENDAREIFEFVSPQSHGATKLPIGIFHSEHLIGVMDVLRGYRTSSEWYIGFMLLVPSFRGQGFGTENIVNSLVTLAAQTLGVFSSLSSRQMNRHRDFGSA